MHIKIKAETRRGLKIIDEFADNALGKISGYNGIGKTNAIKLLSLCTGGQPFHGDDASWRSFRDHLGSATVEISGLRGEHSIRLELTPARWPNKAVAPAAKIGKLQIDGKTVSHDAIFPILSVHHILVAETPLDVLTNRVNTARRDVTSWIESVGSPRRNSVDLRLRDLAKTLNEARPARVSLDITAAAEASSVAGRLTDRRREAQERVVLLTSAVDVSDRLLQVRGRGPEIDQKLAKIHEDLRRIDQQTLSLDKEIADASRRENQDRVAQREFENARKNLVLKQRAVREVTEHFDRHIAAAGVPRDIGTLAAEQESLAQELQKLVDLLPQISATPMLIAALEGLADHLVEAERNDLGDSLLLEPANGRPGWTVTELRTACLNQAAELVKRTPSAEAQALTERIANTRNRIDAIARATSVLERLIHARVELERAEGRLQNATKKLPAQDAQTLDDLISKRKELDDLSGDLRAEQARLMHARELLGGGQTEDALSVKLYELCDAAGVDAARIRRQLDLSRRELDDLTREHAVASQVAEAAERAAEDRVHALGSLVERLAASSDFAWVRSAVGAISNLPSMSATDQATALERICDRVELARSELSDVFNRVQGLGRSFARLHDGLKDRSFTDEVSNEFDVATRLWLADQVRQWFQDPLIREALFDNGTDIRVTWQDLNLHWTSDGKPQSRPLTQFSSGEQAYAYTHAQLAQLERATHKAENRLIAIDEFSSFIDAMRMRNLKGYLRERSLRLPQDQVVVILPLESIPDSRSNPDDETLRRIHLLERRGYLSEPLNP